MSNAGPSSEINGEFRITFTSSLRNRVKIPELIFRRFLEGKTYAPLILTYEGRPGLMWGVETEGRKLTIGWNKFANDNDLIVGDVLIFQYDGDQRFHVTNCGQIWDITDDDEVTFGNPNIGNTHDAESPLGNEERFVTLRVTADKMENERMYLPQSFSEAHELYKFMGKDVFMVGEDETKFPVTIKAQHFPTNQRLQLAYGLRDFLESNEITVNDEITMEMLRDGTSPPPLKLRSKVAVVPN